MGRFIDITGAPIASDFQEMPLDFMAKALDVKQKSLDTFRSDADKGLPVDVGLRTEWVKKYADKTYTPELERIAKNAVANPQGASRELASLRTKMDKDPYINAAKQDAAVRDFVTKNEYTLKQKGVPVIGYRDAQSNIIPVSQKDIDSGKSFDVSSWYPAVGFEDYISPTRTILKEAPNIKKVIQSDIAPYLAQIGGVGTLLTQGKSVSHIDKQTMDGLKDDINTAVDHLLNSGSGYSNYFKGHFGITDALGNMLVTPEEARKRAKDFVVQEANNFIYDNSSYTKDLTYSAPPSGDGSGKKPKTPPVIREAGTTPEQYVKEQYDRVSATNKDQIKKDLTMRVAKIIGDPSINRNDKNLQAEFKKISKPDGSIDPNKLVSYDLSKLNPYLAGNSTLAQSMSDLYMLQSDYSTLQQVDDESDVIAQKRSGMSMSTLDRIKELENKNLSSLNPEDKKDIQELLKLKTENRDIYKNYTKIKKEESEKLLKSALEKQSKVKYLDFNDAQDQGEFDRDVQTSIISNINNSADGVGYFTNWKTGKKSELPKGYELDKSKYRGHIKTPDGKYKTLFSIYNKDDKELGVYTLDESPSMLTSQYQQGSIDPATGVNYEDVFDNISTSFSEQSKDSSNPESTLLDKDTRPVGYTKPILQNNKQVATMRIDNNNQRVYTLTPDIIAAYNSVAPSLGKNMVSSKNTFDINDVTKIVTIALANQ